MAGERAHPAARRLQFPRDGRAGVAERPGHDVEVGHRSRPERGHQFGESPSQRSVEGRGGVRVAAGRALVDDHDGALQPGRVPDVPEAGHHGERRPQDNQGPGPFDHRVAGFGPRPGHVLAEEHHVGLEHAVTGGTVHDLERLGGLVVQDRVPVGVDGGQPRVPAGIGRLQPPVQLGARRPLPARQADDPVQAAVQLGDPEGARRLVQAVHVLRDDPGQQPAAAHLGHGAMTVVRHRPGDVPPAQVTARPVPAPRRLTAGEGLVRHRLRPPGQAGRAPVVRDTRLGGQPGAAQDEHAAGSDHVDQGAERSGGSRLGQLGHAITLFRAPPT